MAADRKHPKSSTGDRTRIVLICVAVPVILILGLSGLGFLQAFNVFCWNGVDVVRYPDGTIKLETTYRGGRRHGRQTKYYPGGRKMLECAFREGKLEGLRRTWNQEGRLEEETEYVAGKIHGISTLFDEMGRPSSVETFRQGVRVRSVFYVRRGEEIETFEAEYREGKPWSGEVVRYVSNQGFRVYTYSQGKLKPND